MFDNFIIDNKLNNYRVIVTEERYWDLYKAFIPERRLVRLDLNQNEIDESFKSTITLFKGKRIIVPIVDRFERFRDQISLGLGGHFSNYIQKSLHAELPNKFRDPSFDPVVIKSAEEKASKIKLNLNKFVFLFPEAVTASSLRTSLWQEIGLHYKNKGYDVLINLTKPNHDFDLFKSTNLTIPEALYLAGKSKLCISLVSGLTVCLCSNDNLKIYLYTQQTPTIGYRLSAKEMLESYSLKDFPYKGKLFEINADDLFENEILNEIFNLTKENFE